MLLLTALAFSAVFALAAMVLAETLGGNASKIVAALEGRSQLTEPLLVTRPVSVRVASRRVSCPVTVQPQLRAAA